jgi:hypothetical protein
MAEFTDAHLKKEAMDKKIQISKGIASSFNLSRKSLEASRIKTQI